MDKIILFQPLNHPDYWRFMDTRTRGMWYMPHGLISIGTVLKNDGFDVVIVDAYINPNYLSELMAELDGRVLLVGIPSMTPSVPHGLEITRHIKKFFPETKIVWGGVHASLLPEQTIADRDIDFVIVGEGEYPMLELCRLLQRRSTNFESVPSLYFKRDGKIGASAQATYHDQELPLLDYSLIDRHMERYINRTVIDRPRRVFTILTGRSCSFRCTFCLNTLAHNQRRNYSVQYILPQIETAITRYGANAINIQDENIWSNIKAIREVFDECIARGYRFDFMVQGHSAYFNERCLNEEFIDRYIGGNNSSGIRCIGFALGVESGNPRILKLIRKGLKLDIVESLVRRLARYDFLAIATSYMGGFPTETREELLDTVKFYLKLRSITPRLAGAFSPLRPYPGAEISAICKEYGFQEPDSLEGWSKFCHHEGFQNINDSVWVSDIEFLKKIYWVMHVLAMDRFLLSNPLYRLAWLFLVAVFRMRIALNFWGIPIDFWILNKRIWKRF